MDAKSKANFINSVAAGEMIPCPKCGAKNSSDSKFCELCGSSMTAPVESAPVETAPAFEPVAEAAPQAESYTPPASAFANGLPDWDINPPQVVVRRH